ncbi:MAG: antitoxin Xre/MbcA/ParS toxin-binding domain-containing protein [Chitinophagaceae bacterium]
MEEPIEYNEKKLDQEIQTIVQEACVDYHSNQPQKAISFSDFFTNKMMMISVIKEGVPYSLFKLIQQYSPFSENDWAGLLDISTKSLQRYKISAKSFKSSQSEKILEVAEVTNMGREVFGDMNKFKLWLNTPNFSLGNLKPFDLLSDSYGKEMVISELTRINYGILV